MGGYITSERKKWKNVYLAEKVFFDPLRIKVFGETREK